MKNRLKALRTGRAWTQDVLAGQLGVSRQTVNAIENGRHTPNLPIAFRIARLFGVAAEDVFEIGDELFSRATSAGADARTLDLPAGELPARDDVAIPVPPSYYTTLERTLREAAAAAR